MPKQQYDIVLIGGGIMSATLGAILQKLMPEAKMVLFEKLPKLAEESSSAWNNAGTGHSAYCELNYTSMNDSGEISIEKAIKIAEQFEVSKQFWSYMIKNKHIKNPREFIHQIAHSSIVFSESDKFFLKKRWDLLKANPLFNGMEYSENEQEIANWFPLVMQDRKYTTGEVAATRMKIGTDLDFGKLTKKLIQYIENQLFNEIYLNHQVNDINKNSDGSWELEVTNEANGIERKVDAKFVFIGAGGGSLKLLNKANIHEVDGYGGFPVGGKWLVCKNEKVIAKHEAKVYGKAEIGAPPMSVPHLDTRIIDGKKQLLFGPFAGFSPKFLKNGSFWDLPDSMDLDNFIPMIQAGLGNFPLTKYLIEQVRMPFEVKMDALRKYMPSAKNEDWELLEAGQRVQVIKKNKNGEGVLEFGTELICTQDGTLAGLMGASPGASTAVSVMLELLEKCFPSKISSSVWQHQLTDMIPSYGKQLHQDHSLLNKIRIECAETLLLS